MTACIRAQCEGHVKVSMSCLKMPSPPIIFLAYRHSLQSVNTGLVSTDLNTYVFVHSQLNYLFSEQIDNLANLVANTTGAEKIKCVEYFECLQMRRLDQNREELVSARDYFLFTFIGAAQTGIIPKRDHTKILNSNLFNLNY